MDFLVVCCVGDLESFEYLHKKLLISYSGRVKPQLIKHPHTLPFTEPAYL